MKPLIGSLLLMVGCVHQGMATGYHPRNDDGGYENISIGDNRYAVSFTGNRNTEYLLVKKFALQRAQELCQANGINGYLYSERITSSDPYYEVILTVQCVPR